jgi:hypothetical protein
MNTSELTLQTYLQFCAEWVVIAGKFRGFHSGGITANLAEALRRFTQFLQADADLVHSNQSVLSPSTFTPYL